MKSFFLWLAVAFYVIAGVNHFLHPEFYERIMPLYVPYHSTLIVFTGVLEIIFGLLLIPKQTRIIVAWLIIVLLIFIFPANIQMAINFYNSQNSLLWLAIARLPLQFIFIWWMWIYTKK